MPLISTLIDNFNDGIVGPEWGNAYGGVSEPGGRARVPCVAGQYAGYQTGKVYTLAGSSVYLQVPLAAAVNGGTVEVQTVFAITPDPTQGTNLAFNINTVTGTIRCESNTNYSDGAATSLTYSATTHAWLRIRETGGTLYWDTSTDGSTWTNRRTLATPAWVTSSTTLALDLWSYRNNGTSNYAEFDNVNTTQNGAVITGAANLSVATGQTATGIRTAVAAAGLAGTADLAASPRVSLSAAAVLDAESRLTATAAGPDLADAAVTVREPMLRWRVGEPWL